MGAFAKGDVVLFPFPYTDLSQRKLRPCLVLSEEMKEDVILCQITSQKVPKNSYAVELRKNETYDGTLHIDSYIRANMLFTASKKQIVKKICTLSAKKYAAVVSRIRKIIELS